MTVALALLIPGSVLAWMLRDGRKHHRKVRQFRQQSHVRVIRSTYKGKAA